jgi:DNA polymerase III subunit epsilon
MKPPVLPVYYYHDHFTEMLSFVSETYGSVLTEQHRAFIATFRVLTKDSQCLLVRMINRRGKIFRRDALRYDEISDTRAALEQLRQSELVRQLTQEDYAAFVLCHPKDALIKGGKDAGCTDIRASWAKAKLIEHFLANVSFAAAYEHCGGRNFVALGDVEPVEFLLYLYFGKTKDDLKNFTLRDLGLLRTNKNASPSARFTDESEARACFHYSRLLNRLELRLEADHYAAIDSILDGPPCTTDYATELRSRAAHKMGLYFEKCNQNELAARLYQSSSSAEYNERLARLLYTSGDKLSAEKLLCRMIDDPASDDEFVFASDFYARKFNGQRTGLCTALLRSGSSVTVDDLWRGNPEAGVASVMRRKGFKVYRAENKLWNCLFGLLFWDELFESHQLHSNFDWVPQRLENGTFARLFAASINEKLAFVASDSALPLILRVLAAHWRQPNGIFAWDWIDMEALCALLTAQPKGVAAMLRLMGDEYRSMRDGFPDLMTEKNGSIAFIEVKAEGDVVRRNQLTRLRQLADAGIEANIARVDFRFDPGQDYVVVDVETTGSWSKGDRITEIGAVKIRDHEIIGEWHSLINPQRAIPANIIRLTGITNEMVRDAPLFAEVADSFMQFMEYGVFAAHNVNFDYGFISHEYERLERRFRFPKICTCAGMRRCYQGHKSYSLGALCEIYGISLTDHHRALCDARAAAHLLNLINEKRVSRLEADGASA